MKKSKKQKKIKKQRGSGGNALSTSPNSSLTEKIRFK